MKFAKSLYISNNRTDKRNTVPDYSRQRESREDNLQFFHWTTKMKLFWNEIVSLKIFIRQRLNRWYWNDLLPALWQITDSHPHHWKIEMLTFDFFFSIIFNLYNFFQKCSLYKLGFLLPAAFKYWKLDT